MKLGGLPGVFAVMLAVSVRAEEPFKLPDRSLFEAGRFVYERNCMICHGERGDGTGELSAQVIPRPRSFAQGLFKYRSTPFGKLPTNADLERTIRGGLSGTAMGMFTQFSSEELRAVVEYLKSFSRRWRREGNYAAPMTMPEAPHWLADDSALTRHGAAGKPVFEALCASCHGTAGDGQGPVAAALMDEWGFPAVPADLRRTHLRSGSELGDIYRVLMTGLNGTPMVSFADALSPEQKWDVIAYIAMLRREFAGGQSPAKAAQ